MYLTDRNRHRDPEDINESKKVQGEGNVVIKFVDGTGHLIKYDVHRLNDYN